MPREPCLEVVGLLEVEPTILAGVSDATWKYANVEIHKLATRAHSLHALFHVC